MSHNPEHNEFWCMCIYLNSNELSTSNMNVSNLYREITIFVGNGLLRCLSFSLYENLSGATCDVAEFTYYNNNYIETMINVIWN